MNRVTIFEKLYLELLYKASIFDALKEAGVDNWIGYDEVIINFKEKEEEE